MAGPAWIGTLVATIFGGTQADAAQDGVITLHLSDFPSLLQPLGSIRVSLCPISGAYVFGAFYPFIITRDSADNFYAVDSKCTHRGCAANAFDGSRILCPCHGSEFSIDGTVTKGPAAISLTKYGVKFDGVNTITITVPGLGYSITGNALESGPTSRLRLEFPTFDQVEYEIRFRETLQSDWGVVPFATTLDGDLTNMSLTGDGFPKAIWVSRATAQGFYAVAMRIREV